jgi:hypothetical protein
MGKYSFVNRTIKIWNQLPAEVLGTYLFKPNVFRKRVRKAIINGAKVIEVWRKSCKSEVKCIEV